VNNVDSSPPQRLVLSRQIILYGCLFLVFYALVSAATYGLRHFGLINDGDRFFIHVSVGFGHGERDGATSIESDCRHEIVER
jgi:hypothetical protein